MQFMDDDSFFWIDGSVMKWSEHRIPVLTHGLNYGGFVFDGIRSYDGIPFLLEDHCERFLRSCNLTGISIRWSREELVDACKEILEINRLTDGYLRPFALRGSAQIELYPGNMTSHVGIAAWKWPSLFGEESKEAGIPVKVSKFRRPEVNSIPPQAKVAASYLPAMLARTDAVDDGFVDAVLLDAQGDVADVTAANLFLVANSQLVTPIADRCLSGLTRRTVIELAEELGTPWIEKRLQEQDLLAADEMFLAGTAYEIQPVSRLNDTVFPETEVTRKMKDAFQDRVRSQKVQQPCMGCV